MTPQSCNGHDATPHPKAYQEPLMPKYEPSSTPVPDTEPEQIDELWRYIRSDKALSMNSGKSGLPVRRGTRLAGVQRTNKERKAREDSPSEAATSLGESTNTGEPSTVITTASSTKVKKASPYDRDFRAQVLDRRGISIKEEPSVSVWEHFHSQGPESDEDREKFYQEKSSTDSTVWLDTSKAYLGEIVQEYRCMEEQNMCEAEFASYAKETIFRRDPRLSHWQYSGLRMWRPDRRVELVAKPDGRRWASPPVLVEEQISKQYDFDIRPDCGYWLSLQGFNTEYASSINQWAYVIKRQITCPYLFIEFKKDDKGSDSAENQIAAAGSMALHNRYKLRMARIDQAKKPVDLNSLDFSNIKVYGITFRGSSYTIWCITPKVVAGTSQWAGCQMTSVYEGACVAEPDVRGKQSFSFNT